MQHTGFAFLGMELKIENPVLAGDTIHVECEVVEARLSKSRPGRGIVRTFNKVVKQDGTVALTYNPLRMIKFREGGHLAYARAALPTRPLPCPVPTPGTPPRPPRAPRRWPARTAPDMRRT